MIVTLSDLTFDIHTRSWSMGLLQLWDTIMLDL